MIPRYGCPPLSRVSYKIRHGAYAILHAQGALLTTHQAAPTPEFQLPGGGIDPGESPLQALHREVLEETGWRIANPRYFGAFRRFTYMPEYDIWAEKVCNVYLAKPIRALTDPSEPGHIATWLPLNEAASMLGNPGDQAMLLAFIRMKSAQRIQKTR